MPTKGEATFLHQNINSFIALAFVGSFALMMGLVMLNVAFGYNPIVNIIQNQSVDTVAALKNSDTETNR